MSGHHVTGHLVSFGGLPQGWLLARAYLLHQRIAGTERAAGGRCYRARQVALQGGDITGALGAGMAVTAEIKTESRRLIEYLLSPILRYRSGSLRER